MKISAFEIRVGNLDERTTLTWFDVLFLIDSPQLSIVFDQIAYSDLEGRNLHLDVCSTIRIR